MAVGTVSAAHEDMDVAIASRLAPENSHDVAPGKIGGTGFRDLALAIASRLMEVNAHQV